jgi:hypothetical protein
LLFVLFCVLFVCKCVLPPGDNPTAVNKYIICETVIVDSVYPFRTRRSVVWTLPLNQLHDLSFHG